MTLAGRQIVVLGGGIGGLAAALALRGQGAAVTLVEQAPRLTEVGAGLQISPNGLRVIAALGLEPALRARSIAGQAVSLRNGLTDREVTRLDLTRLPQDQTYLFVHRADLVDVLAQAVTAAGITLHLGTAAVAVEGGARPAVVTADGARLGGDLVVAADGLHSVARPVLNGVAAPAFTGQVAWRAVVRNLGGHPPEARVHMGPGRHVVTYPLRDGHSLNLVAVEERSAWAEEGWHHAAAPEDLRAAFSGFGPEVRAIVGQAEAPMLWGLFRHPVARVWGRDGIALVGDAAHPTLPFLAQGANMALEDAWMLGRALAAGEDLAAGLAAYQAVRRDRVVRMIEAANGNAWKYHLRTGPVRAAAHLGLRLAGRMAPGRMVSQFDWLYRYDVTTAPLP